MRKFIVGNNGVLAAGGAALYVEDGNPPAGFTKLQYITASGKSALDTGLAVQATDKLLVKFELSDLTASGDKYIVSCQAGYSGGGLWVETYGNTNKWYVRFGSSSSANVAPATEHLTGAHTIEVRKQYFGVDGERVLTPNYSSMPSTTLNVGGRLAAGGTTATGFYGRLYDVKLYDGNGALRWWGIPAKDADNVAGLYDLVSNVFFKSATAYAFTAGPDGT